MILLFRILTVVMFVISAGLFLGHFWFSIDSFWFTIPLAVGTILNLIASIIHLKKRK